MDLGRHRQQRLHHLPASACQTGGAESLPALVAVHAGSNLGIFAFVVTMTGRIPGATGPMSLWFFL